MCDCGHILATFVSVALISVKLHHSCRIFCPAEADMEMLILKYNSIIRMY